MLWIFFLVLLLFLLWVWTICPNLKRRHTARDKLQPCYAHRGLYDAETPENSLAAFRKAKEKGLGIELDVRLTIDKQVVVIHDKTLLRPAGVDKKVCEVSYNELHNLFIFNSEEKIPLFSEVLEAMKDVPLLVEIKNEENGKEICPLVADLLNRYQGNYCIESFNPFDLYWFRKNRPEVIRGQLTTGFDKDGPNIFIQFLLKNLITNCFARPDFLSYDFNHRHQLSFLIARHLYRTPALGWTIHPDTKEVAEKVYDGIIFEKS